MQSQVRFNRVPEKVPEKVPGSLGAKPSQVQRDPEKVARAKPGQVNLTHGNPAVVFSALGFAARVRKICKNKALRLLGMPPKLIATSWGLKPFDFILGHPTGALRNSREISRSRIPWIPEESGEICRLNQEDCTDTL